MMILCNVGRGDEYGGASRPRKLRQGHCSRTANDHIRRRHVACHIVDIRKQTTVFGFLGTACHHPLKQPFSGGVNESDTLPFEGTKAFGCGIIEDDRAWQDILSLHDEDTPAVWDAGALNLLSLHPMHIGKNTVLTPHAAEAARLLGCTIPEILADPVSAAKAIVKKYNCGVVALKSATTVVTDGERVSLNVVGTSALAKGGSGDALAGILGALLAGGMPLFEAAQGACLWHGLAGIEAEQQFGTRGVLTGNVADALGKCLMDMENL